MKLELIKKTRSDGSFEYWTEQDGSYVRNSVSEDYEEALAFFTKLKRLAIKPKREVLQSIEIPE